ncbi:MAG: 50S ribosomal protein L21 [candidate division WS6 bacterium GW2011_GWA2_37_6]|uniref:50S ribosomal protein L21 n=1 Tax=candidate division WS6 bacterium GW2011_GWA2_37_6 TaxID=1619087 RepID=A0A0G0K1B8_9BACT|nr:MAG: 50S ribosomal protein L21 [candidate division WS6 bacterium GW2011_GWA2_37_6]
MKDDFVVVKIGKSQEIVKKGDEVLVHTISGEPKTKITLDQVLMSFKGGKVELGKPFIASAKVEAIILEQTKGEKVRKETFKAKSRERRHVGFRQSLTKIKIEKI